jgi:hypothetical protein
MAPTIRPARPCELDADDAAIFAGAVVEREPDADVPDAELAWWLLRQEQAETRALLAAAGLL